MLTVALRIAIVWSDRYATCCIGVRRENVVHRRGAALGLLTALGGSTIALTPFIAARVIPRIGWQATWILEGVVVVLMGLVMVGVIRRLRLEHPHADEQRSSMGL